MKQTVLSLLWSPGSLAVVGILTPFRTAVITGLCVAAFELSLASTTLIAPSAEPFNGLADFVHTIDRGTILATPMYLIVFTPFTILFLTWIDWSTISEQATVRISMVFLLSITLLGPITIWSIFSTFRSAHSWDFWDPRVATNLAWVDHPVFNVLGSPSWAFVGMIYVAAVYVLGIFRLKHVWLEYLKPRCANCGYLLQGLRSKECPECGTLFDRDGLA